MNVFGSKLKVSIFGESHGGGIGIVIDGLPPGHLLDMEAIDLEMQRRAPGNSKTATKRREPDKVEILSGLFNGRTTGAPLCGIIRNTDTISKDYNRDLLRPGHADYVAHMKYGGFNDHRGGGHFSGRITAPLTFAGSIAKQLLDKEGICIGSHICQIGSVKDKRFSEITKPILEGLVKMELPVLNEGIVENMRQEIVKAMEDLDSVGGIIEAAAINIPVGLGSPFFGSMESVISSMMFSIPAVKGIEFGEGFALAEMKGSQSNDSPVLEDGKIKMKTNNNGGITGGITNGAPIVFRVVIKPTPSISKEQQTVDITNMENATVAIKGRHDPCIVQRALVVVEAGLALCLLDHLL